MRAAKLSLSEIMQICEQLETTSFDVPDSWETELRGRRVSLGNEANSSADAENYIIYHFDGQFYRQARCYLVRKAQQAERVPCK